MLSKIIFDAAIGKTIVTTGAILSDRKAKLPDHQRVYRKLRDMILFGELAPGQPVTIQGLVSTLDVGMTPVREAIRRLMGLWGEQQS